MRPATVKREPSPAERRKRANAAALADQAFAAFVATLPSDPVTRRWACERLTRLTGAQVAADHGEAALHCALSGAVVAGAPAYRAQRPHVVAAEAMFARPRPETSTPVREFRDVAGLGEASATQLPEHIKSASAAKFSRGDR